MLLLAIMYLLRPTLMYKPKDLNRDWLPRFSTPWDKNGWIRAKNGLKFEPRRVSKPFCDFLADPGTGSFSRFDTNIARSRYSRLFWSDNVRQLLFDPDTLDEAAANEGDYTYLLRTKRLRAASNEDSGANSGARDS
jgi:hypothetical protein